MHSQSTFFQAVLAEAHIKLEDAEVRMREEKDHFEAALQEERERKNLAESNLAKEQMKLHETEEKEKNWKSAEEGRRRKNYAQSRKTYATHSQLRPKLF